MAYGHWSGARGAQNKEEMEGILTKGSTTKGRPRGELATAVLHLHGHRSWEASLVADSCLGVLKRHHHVHAVLYNVLTGLGSGVLLRRQWNSSSTLAMGKSCRGGNGKVLL
jgi:hypothetical protein